ncbi:MAG: 2-keto-4-pentenoate hydratase, partial [Actinomycetota bacterium]
MPTRGLARALYDAERSCAPIPPLTEEYPNLTADDAYEVQQHLVRMRIAEGDSIVGYKVGLTSLAMQELLGVDQPDYGPILSSMMVPDGGAVPASRLIQPRVEAEIAFVLARPLSEPRIGPSDVLRASVGVVPAIEIIDSRIEGWRIRLPDTIADLASSARVVLGQPVPLDGLDLPEVGVVLERNGEEVATGVGAAALG